LSDRQSKEYKDNHNRTSRIRGKASAHKCIKCGEQAKDWSHTHDTDPSDPMNYQPRCQKCHWEYDGISRRFTAVPKSDEAREKMRQAALKRWARKRGETSET
jgi:hypothetical protein